MNILQHRYCKNDGNLTVFIFTFALTNYLIKLIVHVKGRHPFVYALAEFIDNSLRATRNNPPNPQEIIIRILTAGTGVSKRGMICIHDNGCGMSKIELRDWAVMNYTIEERGLTLNEATDAGNRHQEVNRKQYLTGNLSYFGVGSKNAAFFMGSTVKVVTKKAGERYVHELTLAAEDLEKRYRNQEAVYEEDMVHRNPGDTSTLNSMEARFPVTHNWVHEEVKLTTASPTSGFTRVIIGDLKPQILRQLADDQGGAKICTELAHLYHYYIHGQDGNRGFNGQEGDQSSSDAGGRILLNIVVQYQKDNRLVWEKSLRDVDDDFETTLLRTQRAEFNFSLNVPEYGVVAGNLYYFPYENGRETVPFLPSLLKADHQIHEAYAGNTQHGTATQNATLPQSVRGPPGALDGDLSDGDDAHAFTFQAPIFETFWQGRLIPDSRISTLGFVEGVRRKRNAISKDTLPDEAFCRLRGTLFFGPAFHVTRNK
jgi:hypothetical protein